MLNDETRRWGERVAIPASWCAPVPGTCVDGCGAEVPLDVPANLLGVLRAVWRRVTGEEAPLLLTLSRMWRGCWRMDGPRGPLGVEGVIFASPSGDVLARHRVILARHRVIPALEGVTDPLRAAAVIAEAVLGGEA